MAIDAPLRLPDQSAPIQSDTNSWGDLSPSERPAPGLGPQLLELVSAAATAIDQLPHALCQLGESQLTELMGVLLRLHARAGQVGALLVADADTRGAIAASDAANPTQWVQSCAAGAGVPVEPRDASLIANVAQACRDRRNQVATAAVRDGSCTLATARTVLQQTARVAEVLPTASRDDIQSWFLQLDPALGARGVHELTRRIIARYDPDKLSAQDARLEGAESLTWRTLPAGMLRLIADLCPANAAILKSAINALSAPHPAREQHACDEEVDEDRTADAGATATDTYDWAAAGAAHPDGGARADSDAAEQDENNREAHTGTGEKVRDERTSGKRRVDALLDLVSAGAKAACGEGTSVGAGATVLITMGLADLINNINGATTISGDTLDPGAARRFACDADLIPVVLGTPSQRLDVGRRKRLATKGIRAAVVHRDRGCTFASCDRPPGYCEIHHLTPWWAGGDTSLVNSALLCCRHHQIVHRKGYYATVTKHGVVWHLIEGTMPGWRADVAA